VLCLGAHGPGCRLQVAGSTAPSNGLLVWTLLGGAVEAESGCVLSSGGCLRVWVWSLQGLRNLGIVDAERLARLGGFLGDFVGGSLGGYSWMRLGLWARSAAS